MASEAGHRFVERRQRGDRVHDVPEVHDEARGRAHGRDLGEHVAGAGVGEVVGLVRRGGGVLVLVDVGVGDDDEGEERVAARRTGLLGHVGHAISAKGSGYGAAPAHAATGSRSQRLDELQRNAVAAGGTDDSHTLIRWPDRRIRLIRRTIAGSAMETADGILYEKKAVARIAGAGRPRPGFPPPEAGCPDSCRRLRKGRSSAPAPAPFCRGNRRCTFFLA